MTQHLSIRQQSALALLRIITGALMLFHGSEIFDEETMKGYFVWDSFKGFSAPHIIVYAGKAAEFITGLLLIIGLFTRWAALVMAVSMFYICFFVANGKFWYEDQHPFIFGLLALVFVIIPITPYSFDAYFKKPKNN